MPNLSIAEMYGIGSTVNRFRIVEKVTTIDGPRDRFTNMSFASLGEAERFINDMLSRPSPQEDDWSTYVAR